MAPDREGVLAVLEASRAAQVLERIMSSNGFPECTEQKCRAGALQIGYSKLQLTSTRWQGSGFAPKCCANCGHTPLGLGWGR